MTAESVLSGNYPKSSVGNCGCNAGAAQTIKTEAADNVLEGASLHTASPALWARVQAHPSAPNYLTPSLVLKRLRPMDVTMQLAAAYGLSFPSLGRCRQQLMTSEAARPHTSASAAAPAGLGGDGDDLKLGVVPVNEKLGVLLKFEEEEEERKENVEEERNEVEKELELKEEPLFGEGRPASPALVGYLSSELGDNVKEVPGGISSSSSASSGEEEFSLIGEVVKSSKNSPLRYTCHQCSYNTTYKNNLVRHLASHDQEKALPFRCDHCDYMTHRKDFLKRHLLVTHKSSKQKTFSCDKCSFSSNWKHCYKKHLLIHATDREKFTCDVCGYTTVWKDYLDAHMVCHKSDREKRFACSYCDYKTDLKRSIRRHVACHDSGREKPFACAHCEYKTDLKFHLRRHLLTRHANKK